MTIPSPTEIVTRQHTLEINNVVQITVTETEQLEDGSYVREVRVGTKAQDEVTVSQSLVLRVVGETLEGVQLTAPLQEY